MRLSVWDGSLSAGRAPPADTPASPTGDVTEPADETQLVMADCQYDRP